MLYKLALCAPTCKQSISVMAAFENGEPGNDEETGALDLGWQIMADCFDPAETGISSKLTEKFWPKKTA